MAGTLEGAAAAGERRASRKCGPGHPLAEPTRTSRQGTSTDRTMKASMRTPADMVRAISRNGRSGMSASSPKLTASVSAAALMARVDCGNGDDDRIAEWAVPGLLPDGPDAEDVVVGAERDEQDGRREGHVEGHAVRAQQVLEDPDLDPECGREGEHAAGEQVYRRDEGPEEDDEQQEVDDDRGEPDPHEVGGRAGYKALGQRGVPGQGDGRVLQPAGLDEGGYGGAERTGVRDGARSERVAVEHHEHPGGVAARC